MSDEFQEALDKIFAADSKLNAERGFARAGLADHSDGLPLADIQGNAIHRFDVIYGPAQQPFLNGEPNPDVVA